MAQIIPRRPMAPEEVVARATKLILPMYARRGIDATLIATFDRFVTRERIARGTATSVFDAEIDRALQGVA